MQHKFFRVLIFISKRSLPYSFLNCVAIPLNFVTKIKIFWPHGSFYTPRFGLRQIFESREANYVTSSASECII